MSFSSRIKAKQRIMAAQNQGRATLHLDNLDLTSKDLEKLVPFIAKTIPNITNLSLDNNQLHLLPDNITNLRQLRWLNLTNNILQSLPDSIGNLTTLYFLNLDGNCIIKLPDSIENLRNLGVLGLNNNNLVSVPASITRLLHLSYAPLSRNPLSLQSLLNINALPNSQEIFHLDLEHKDTLNRISDITSPEVLNIAQSVAEAYPNTSIEEFNTFFLRLSTDQVLGIGTYRLPLHEVGVGLDAEGNLSNELALKDTYMTLSELLEKTTQIIETVGLTTTKAFDLVKNKPEYLQGILDFGLSEEEIIQIGSIENIKAIYLKINEKIIERAYSENFEELDLGNLTAEEKAYARAAFYEIMGDYSPQLVASSNGNTKKPNQSNTPLAALPSLHNQANNTHHDKGGLGGLITPTNSSLLGNSDLHKRPIAKAVSPPRPAVG